MEKGRVAGLWRYAAKGSPGEKLQSARLVEGVGLEGDCHAAGGERQISLLTQDERQWINAQTRRGLCFDRYKENLLLDGVLPNVIAPGNNVKVGEAVIHISAIQKHCFEECPLSGRGPGCILAGQSLFAGVISSGIVQIGDPVEQGA
jgi:cyclic pyranopterin phosphate synthase